MERLGWDRFSSDAFAESTWGRFVGVICLFFVTRPCIDSFACVFSVLISFWGGVRRLSITCMLSVLIYIYMYNRRKKQLGQQGV